jgi:hypothetical protein
MPAGEVTKIEETLGTLGCSGYESLKKEEQGIYEIDAAKRKMGTLDLKLDKDYTVILISRNEIATKTRVLTVAKHSQRRPGSYPVRFFFAPCQASLPLSQSNNAGIASFPL